MNRHRYGWPIYRTQSGPIYAAAALVLVLLLLIGAL